jgi:hypothetical protein
MAGAENIVGGRKEQDPQRNELPRMQISSALPPALPSALEVTDLLIAWRTGDQSALNQLMPIVYDELWRVTHRHLQGERAGHVLQTIALVIDVYLRLVASCQDVAWQNCALFFALQRLARIYPQRAHRGAKVFQWIQ